MHWILAIGFVLWTLAALAFGIWRGRIYWGDILTDAQDERDKATAVLAKVKTTATQIGLDVKKVFPFLMLLLVFGACFAFAQDEKPQAQRTPMQSLQLRKMKLTYELLAARINGNDTNAVFAEQLLDDVDLEMQLLSLQDSGSSGVSLPGRRSYGGMALVSYQGPAGVASYWHHGQAVLPDPKVTPGMIEADLVVARLCDPSFHTGTVRNVPESEKRDACREYGIADGCPGKGYELDHLISIELGGSNDIQNLWPQPADAPGLIGYHTKDVVENRAHRAVCDGKLTLAQAQAGIRTDWYEFGLTNGFIGEAGSPKGQKRATAP